MNNIDIYFFKEINIYKKRFLTILLLTLSIATSYSQIQVIPNRPNALYEAGETAQYIVTSTESGTATFTLKYDNSAPPISTGTINLVAGQPQIIFHSEPTPDLVLCEVVQNSNRASCGIAFSPYEIEPLEEFPSDLDAFWNAKKQDLANIPLNPVINFHSANDYSTSYEVTLDNIDGRKVYGYLSIPNSTGPFPAIITMPPFGYISNITSPEYSLSERAGVLSFSVGIHNVPPSQQDPNAYEPDIYENRDGNYYKYALLGAVRAIDYLFTRSDFDMQNIGVTGVSQGGGLSIALAGIDDRINLLMYSVPALCQNAGLSHGKAGGFPNYVNRSRGEIGTIEHEQATNDATRYYDGTFLAQACDYPVLGFTSYEDVITPAATGFAAFNALPNSAPRVLMHSLSLAHENPPEYFQGRFDFIHRHFPSSIGTTPFPWNNNSGYHIDAGNDTMIAMGEIADLSATIELNTNLNPTFDLKWSVVEGPGTVSFSNPNDYNTTATFSQFGEYVLQFTGLDTAKLHSNQQYFTLIDYVTVSVEELFALPIELVDFSSSLRNDDVLLSWETSSEINNKGFELLRSSDFLQPVTSIAWVDGTNSSSGDTYSFLDENVEKGKTFYYQLKQIDFDESYSYSPVISELVPFGDFKIKIHPNPVNEKLQISFSRNGSHLGKLKIVSILGNILFEEKIQTDNHFYKEINLKEYSKGTYFLWLELNNQEKQVYSFFKL